MGSRVAGKPIHLPKGVELTIKQQLVSVKGPKGSLQLDAHKLVDINQEDAVVNVAPRENSQKANALAGTIRALVNNLVTGVTQGYERKLKMVGVGYRAQVKGSSLNLTVGFSHPVDFLIPEGITIETPSQTEIVVKGIDKQQVGQVSANIRRVRPPEPYKGKGICYADERIVRKEAKKK